MFKNKARQYTPQQTAFLEAIKDPANKGNLKACMAIAGYTKATSVAIVISSLKDEIIEVAKEILAANSVQASLVIAHAMEEADPLTAVRTQNAERILDRVGIVKGERVIVDNAPNRVAILPRRNAE